MRVLPLYPTPPAVPVETETPRSLNANCTLCPLHEGRRTVCMDFEESPDWQDGDLLILGESPGGEEDKVGRPFVGKSGILLRDALQEHWTRGYVIDNAIRCAPGKTEVKEKHVAACRGYLAKTLQQRRPGRIVTLGGWAAFALLGRSVAPFSTRGGFTWLYGYGEPIPVFTVLHPAAALRNSFVRKWFEADMRHALTAPVPEQPPLDAQVRIVTTPEEARGARRELQQAEWVAFDVETCGVIFTPSFRLLCVSFCAATNERPITWDEEGMKDPQVRAELVHLLLDAKLRKVGANVKYDELAVESALGVRPRNVRGDVRLWRKLLEPEADARLERMAELVGMGGMKEEAQVDLEETVDRVKKAIQTERRLARNAEVDKQAAARGERVKKRAPMHPKTAAAVAYWQRLQKTEPALCDVIKEDPSEWGRWAYGLAPRPLLLRYNARDTVATKRLATKLETQLVQVPSVDRVRRLVVDRAAHGIKVVEGWGVCVDRQAIDAFDSYLLIRLQQVRNQVDVCARQQGMPDFDPASHHQVRELLYDRLKLPVVKMTDNETNPQPSTDAEVLEILALRNPVAQAITRWRYFDRMQTHYASGMARHIRADGRIHTHILLDGARSGRTSSQDPNLQNIPRPDDKEKPEGKMARDCFVPSPGFTFMQLDYSQLELRIAAMLSRDEAMIDIFRSGVDYHLRTAQLVSKTAWGINPEDVKKPHRTAAKTINFGVLYGMGDGALGAKIGADRATARRVREAIMGKFKRLDAWIAECLAEARKTGFAWTWWDGQRARRRPLWRVADKDEGARIVAEHGAHNTPVQGTASEFCVASIADAVEWIEEERLEDRIRLLLPVHDSLLFEVRNDFVPYAAAAVQEIMLGHASDGVPIEVDCEVGPSWGSLEKWDIANGCLMPKAA